MDDATTSNDIRLREGSSIAQRLVVAGSAAAVALCFAPGLFTHDILEVIISVVALLAGAAFVGSYTTFSTWMFETQRLGEDRQVRPLAANLVVSLVAGVAAAAAGRWIGGHL